MHAVFTLSPLVNGSVLSIGIGIVTIIISSFIIEDPTTVAVGMLVSAGSIPMGIALPSLYLGIIGGDIAFYFIGRLARTHPKLERYVEHDFIAPLKTWLEERYVLTVFVARFIPGARMPIYSASGFFRTKSRTFITTVVIAGLVWGTLLFFGAYWFNSATASWLGWTRWFVILFFLCILFFVGRYNLRAIRLHRAKRNGACFPPTHPDAA